MLMKMAVLHRIKDGKISVVYRRWRRPTVKSDGILRTAVGLLKIMSVEDVSESAITTRDVSRAGYATRSDLIRDLGTRSDRLSRVTLAYAGADSRIALREADVLSETNLARLVRLYARSTSGPWTKRVLAVTGQYPDVAARILAEHLACEKDWLKPNVHKLKNLGLTISHDPGYSLSPRGRVVLTHLRATDAPSVRES